MFPTVDFSKSHLEHLKIYVLPFQDNDSQDSAVAVNSVFLDLDGPVKHQAGQIFCGPLAERLAGPPLLLRFLGSVNADEPVIRDLKLLSVDLDRPISDLLAEAIADLVRKHGRTEVAYSTIGPESKKGKK